MPTVLESYTPRNIPYSDAPVHTTGGFLGRGYQARASRSAARERVRVAGLRRQPASAGPPRRNRRWASHELFALGDAAYLRDWGTLLFMDRWCAIARGGVMATRRKCLD